MSCGYEEDLTAYLDGELSPSRREEVSRHLSACSACHQVEAGLRRAVEHLATLPAFEPSAALRRAVLNRLDEEPTGLLVRLRAWFRPVVLVPSLGLLAAVVAVVVASPGPRLELSDASQLELAANMEVVEDLELLGVDDLADLEVVEQLHELEVMP